MVKCKYKSNVSPLYVLLAFGASFYKPKWFAWPISYFLTGMIHLNQKGKGMPLLNDEKLNKIKTSDVMVFYGNLFFELREILLKTDPVGLYSLSKMIDEYDLEAKYILLQIDTINKNERAITNFIFDQFERCLYKFPANTKGKFKMAGRVIHYWLITINIKPYPINE